MPAPVLTPRVALEFASTALSVFETFLISQVNQIFQTHVEKF